MADNIVTRLQMFSLDDGTDALNKLLTEATDEIERLRRQVSTLEESIRYLTIQVAKNV